MYYAIYILCIYIYVLCYIYIHIMLYVYIVSCYNLICCWLNANLSGFRALSVGPAILLSPSLLPVTVKSVTANRGSRSHFLFCQT